MVLRREPNPPAGTHDLSRHSCHLADFVAQLLTPLEVSEPLKDRSRQVHTGRSLLWALSRPLSSVPGGTQLPPLLPGPAHAHQPLFASRSRLRAPGFCAHPHGYVHHLRCPCHPSESTCCFNHSHQWDQNGGWEGSRRPFPLMAGTKGWNSCSACPGPCPATSLLSFHTLLWALPLPGSDAFPQPCT